jgi:hypothetical protein
MRVLRLTNSNDENPLVPEDERAPAVAARAISALTGESVETEIRHIWPGRSLPERAVHWIDEVRPDVVLVRASSFWVTWESVPLKLQRRLGRLGTPLARAGFKIGANDKFAYQATFRRGRIWAARTVGGVTYFTPQEATELLSAMLRRIRTNESLIVVVRGPSYSHNAAASRRAHERAESRRAELEELLAGECERLHIPFWPRREPLSEAHLLGDDVHDNAEGHRVNGELDGEAVAAAWNAVRAH